MKKMLGEIRTQFEGWLRLWDWWIYAAIAVTAVAVIASQQIGVLVWKIALVAMAVVLGYLADRALFYRAARIDPELPRDIFGAARLLCRAVIVLGVILGLTEGL